MSFIDRLRQTPTTSKGVTVFGFDPDADTTGWARITGTISKPALGFPAMSEARLGLIESKARGLRDVEQAEEMVRAVTTASATVMLPPPDAVFVEAQQIYPNPDEDPKTRVAKANDLMRLAQVTGAVQATAHFKHARLVRAVLPAVWKGQVTKDVSIGNSMQLLRGVRIILVHMTKPHEEIPADKLDKLPGKMSHALDALGIALYGIEWLSLHQEQL